MVEMLTITNDPTVEHTAPNFLGAAYRQGGPETGYEVRESIVPEKITVSAFPRCEGEPEGAGHASMTVTDEAGESVNVHINRDTIAFLARTVLGIDC